LLDNIQGEGRAGLDQVLELRHSNDLAAALEEVRKGDAAAAVEEQGSRIVLHYSAADRVKAGTVQALFRELVQSGNLAANPVPPQFELASVQVEDQSLKVIQYLTPGLLGWAVATGAMFGAALTLVTWRQKKCCGGCGSRRCAPVRSSAPGSA
jgi:ABC-2 type transport system permease protein